MEREATSWHQFAAAKESPRSSTQKVHGGHSADLASRCPHKRNNSSLPAGINTVPFVSRDLVFQKSNNQKFTRNFLFEFGN